MLMLVASVTEHVICDVSEKLFGIRVKATGTMFVCVNVWLVWGGGVDLALSSIQIPGRRLSVC